MRVFKVVVMMVLRVMVLPMLCVAVLIKLIGLFAVGCSAWFFRLLSGVLFLTAILSWLMGIENTASFLRMLVGTFTVFLLPLIGEGIIAASKLASKKLARFIFPRRSA